MINEIINLSYIFSKVITFILSLSFLKHLLILIKMHFQIHNNVYQV